MRTILIIILLSLAANVFSQSTDGQLTTQANVIRNETNPGANTRTRIADMFQGIIDSKPNLLTTYTNPSWIGSLSWGKISGTPTTLSGYGITSPLMVNQGGVGISSYTIGDIIYASGTTTLAKLPSVATGNAFISGGVGAAPSWGKIGLTTHISGVLPIANGGTNLTSLGSALQSIRVNAGATALEYYTPSGTIGGSSGSVDNAILRSDGTGGSTIQSGAMTLDDNASQLTLGINGSTSGTSRAITVNGSQANIDITINSKGTGSVKLIPGANGLSELINTVSTATSTVNAITLFMGSAGSTSSGFGGSINYTFQNGSGGTTTDAAEIGFTASSTTAGSESIDVVFKAKNSGSDGERFRIVSDGRLYGTAIHNNSSSVTGTTNQYIASGTWTGTVTNSTNTDAAVTVSEGNWIRVGNQVHFSFEFTADPTLTTTTTSFELSLPASITSNFTATSDAGGTASCAAIAGQVAAVSAQTTNDKIIVTWKAGDVTSQTWSAHGLFEIK